MSFVNLCIYSEDAKLKFREVEKVAQKICLLNSHLSFNETCLNIKLLPTFTNIYIYIKNTHIFYTPTHRINQKLIFSIFTEPIV